ncbi:flagellar assembly protein H,flagellar assembly protein FliH [Chlamydia poikilotherma]|uniref:Flagellar assembly protein H,flagellar assembly protein FliH n=1 Tax=Chlamydia poikilotherma TaxID=1967783 RepID=A0A3B0Q905_9CHLA|nr:flagellar assembly protein H,flagellar assembly protein FliH [Chlamydia poikilotherma]
MTLSQSPGSLSDTGDSPERNKDWDEGFSQGFSEGETSGYDKAFQELLSLIQIFRKLSIRMLSEIEKVPQQLKPDLVELAILTCEKFLYKKLDNVEELALLISSALQQHTSLRSLSPIKIFLHPEDHKKLNDWIATHEVPMIKHAEFLPDTSCKKSSYKMEVPSGILRQEIGEELDHLLSVLTA